jgi:RND family efflux transporter MFP subunit
MLSSGLKFLTCLFLLASSVGQAASETVETLQDRELDCLVEPRLTIKLGADVPGLIDHVSVDRGDVVKAGQVVAKLKSGVEEASLELARTKATNDLEVKTNTARAQFLRRKADRQVTLRQTNAVAFSTLDEAETDAQLSELATTLAALNLRVAQLEVARQEEMVKQRTIVSPVDGVVVEKALSAGEYANDTNHILTIAQIDPLNVEVFVPVAYYNETRIGSEADIFPENPIGGHYKAKVAVIDQVLDAASGTFGVRLVLPNPGYELPGGIRCKIRFGPR